MTTLQTDATATLPEFLTRTRNLLSEVDAWSKQLGLRVTPGVTAINEERYGQYEAPTLILDDTQGKRMAEVVPFGASILGAWGRVDVVGEYGKREKIVYLSAGGPTMTTRIRVGDGGEIEESTHKIYRGVDAEGWYWVSPSPIRRAYPLTREVLADLLSAVSGHEF